MTRLIALGLLLLILRLAVKNFSGQLKTALFGPSQPSRPPQVASETLVQCARCGTYLASSRSLRHPGAEEADVFCSEECRREKVTSSAR